jgi:nitric oxide reductase subunit B
MGTTIGINTLILLSSIAYILEITNPLGMRSQKNIQIGIKIFHSSFLLFWITLLLLGAKKGYWTFFNSTISFGKFQDSLHWIYTLFTLFGIGILIGLYMIVFEFLKKLRSVSKNNIEM